MTAFTSRLAEIDSLIARHQIAAARASLKELSSKRIAREHLARVAHLYRWALQPEQALRLLHKTIRPKPRQAKAMPASELEKLVYGAALTDVGAYYEGHMLLASLNAETLPEVYLQLARNHAFQWNWDQVIPLAEALLANDKAKSEDRLHAQLHLAAALMRGSDQYAKSEQLLGELLAMPEVNRARYYLKDALQLMAENQFLRGKTKEGLALVERLKKIVTEDNDQIFGPIAQLWDAILRLENEGSAALKQMRAARDEFIKQRRWDRVRLAELYETLATANEKLFIRMHFGTPYPGFRQILAQKFGRQVALPTHYDWELTRSAKPRADTPVLDVFTAHATIETTPLKAGQVPQRLLEVLSSDLYKPQRIAELHAFLFPAEYYNPISSPDRVHQGLRRLRAWIAENRLPLYIDEFDGFYALKSKEPFLFRVRKVVDAKRLLQTPVNKKIESYLLKLSDTFKGQPFAATQAADALAISYRSAVRYLSTAHAEGHLARLGSGPSTKYALASKD